MCTRSSMRTICTATRRSPRAQSGSSKGEQILPTERPTALCCYVGRLERAERNQLAAAWWTTLLTTVHESAFGTKRTCQHVYALAALRSKADNTIRGVQLCGFFGNARCLHISSISARA